MVPRFKRFRSSGIANKVLKKASRRYHRRLAFFLPQWRESFFVRTDQAALIAVAIIRNRPPVPRDDSPVNRNPSTVDLRHFSPTDWALTPPDMHP
jgi:hypothetical protein